MLSCCTQGQAQECFVEKSLKGVGRVKNNTVAKLAARVRVGGHRVIMLVYHHSISLLHSLCTRSRSTTVNALGRWKLSHATSSPRRTKTGLSFSK